jgi:hypothetical protein
MVPVARDAEDRFGLVVVLEGMAGRRAPGGMFTAA